MRCGNCGEQNPEGNRFCANCGAAIGELPDTEVVRPPAAPGEGPAPGTTPLATGAGDGTADEIGPPLPVETFERPGAPGPLRDALVSGWGTAVGSAALTFLVMALIGEGLAALVYAAAGSAGPDLGQIARIGGLFTYSFHRVGVHATFPDLSADALGGGASPFPGGNVSISVTIALAMLLGTVLLAWLLYRAGRSLGRDAGGPGWVRGLSGARVALPYAVITGGVAAILAAIPLSFDIPELPGFTTGGSIELSPSIVAAILWPLGIGLVAGFAGGLATAPRDGWHRPRFETLAAGAVRGG
ncbi:MAG: zinc ribbon domain-containing protein, partial [Actinobacteria bacterium]|nr:zinc ribbon domain-containing protein [Actinomycetota bacterium]